ncbi:MAG TPA: carbohydrate kinase family protein [Spirochaetia bacterium]|nr:carbohydrate kinase family protein [Spirochaetia bacterium]
MSEGALLTLSAPRYRVLVGTGGIGSGSFFQVNGNHTLGREESRSGRYLHRRDYCKLHIVCHYVKRLAGDALTVIPVGRVGNDEVGRRLLSEMQEAGLRTNRVRVLEGAPTLFSFCIQYPDGSGGNLTTDNSACSAVTAEMIDDAAEDLPSPGGGIVLAVPEVPFAPRRRLLRLGGERGLLRVASFTSEELPRAEAEGVLADVDLLAMNGDEARSLLPGSGLGPTEDVVARFAGYAGQRYPALRWVITAGAEGSWSWDGRTTSRRLALPVRVVGASGAGDAHLAGIIAGLAGGLELHPAHDLGCILAAASLASEHTINTEITREQLRELARLADLHDEALLRMIGSTSA